MDKRNGGNDMELAVLEQVAKYFKGTKGVEDYEPIGVMPTTEPFLFRVIAKKKDKDEYTVWKCFNTSTGSMNCGVYLLTYEEAMEIFKRGSYIKGVSYNRLSELATKFKDGLIEDNAEEALKYFLEECDMTDDELEYFGIEKPKKYKEIDVEVCGSFKIVLPEDADEDYFIDNDLVIEDHLDELSTTGYILREGLDKEYAEHLLSIGYDGDLDYV